MAWKVVVDSAKGRWRMKTLRAMAGSFSRSRLEFLFGSCQAAIVISAGSSFLISCTVSHVRERATNNTKMRRPRAIGDGL